MVYRVEVATQTSKEGEEGRRENTILNWVVKEKMHQVV